MNLDMNLLESPPMALLNEGIETIVKYCTARAKIVLGLSKKLTSSGEILLVFNQFKYAYV